MRRTYDWEELTPELQKIVAEANCTANKTVWPHNNGIIRMRAALPPVNTLRETEAAVDVMRTACLYFERVRDVGPLGRYVFMYATYEDWPKPKRNRGAALSRCAAR